MHSRAIVKVWRAGGKKRLQDTDLVKHIKLIPKAEAGSSGLMKAVNSSVHWWH
jgi:hypothetical protein